MPAKAMPAKANAQANVPEEDDDDLFHVPTLLEPDTYLVKLVGLRKHDWGTPNQFNPDKPNVSLMWKMEFAKMEDGEVTPLYNEDDGEPLAFEFSTSTSTSPNGKAAKYATAFIRRAPKQDEWRMMKGLLLNKKALAATGQRDNGFPFIVDLYPYTGK